MNQMTRWNIIAENGRRAPRGAGRGSMELDQGIITKEVTRFRSAGYIALIGRIHWVFGAAPSISYFSSSFLFS